MKKIMILAACAATVLSACAKIETEKFVDVDDAITFGAYSGRSANTKANSIGTVKELAAQGGFGVFAYYTANANFGTTSTPNFMWNQAVTSSDEGVNWTYSPIKYWPNNDSNTTNGSATWTDHVSFFAYAPVATAVNTTGVVTGATAGITNVPTNTTAGDPKITYVVATDPANSVDFLYNDEATTNLTKQAVTGKVTFNFKHALARLGLTVKGVFDSTTDPGTDDVDDNTKIYIQSLEITTDSNLPGTGIFNLNTKQWESKTGTATLALGTSIPSSLTGDPGVTKTEVSLIAPSASSEPQYYMVLPNDDAVNYNFHIVYKVVTTDAALDGGKSEITNNITKKASIKFEAGKAYNVKLDLGMTTVKLAATVTDWTDAGEAAVIWLPINQ